MSRFLRTEDYMCICGANRPAGVWDAVGLCLTANSAIRSLLSTISHNSIAFCSIIFDARNLSSPS